MLAIRGPADATWLCNKLMPTACLTAILVSAGADASCLITAIYPLVAILSIRGRLENVLIPDIPKIPHIPRTEFSLSLSLALSVPSLSSLL
jgi:hypothetical protein